MPLTSRQPVLKMSPELISKLEAASKSASAASPKSMPKTLVSALEKTLDGAKVLVKETKIDHPNEHVVIVDSPTPELQDENVLDAEDIPINQFNEGLDDENNEGLFEVSVDISEPSEPPESDQDSLSSYTGAVEECKRNSLTFPAYHDRRRSSRWSATVFLASEVQMMVNLAQLSPPEGYEMAPKKVGQTANASTVA